jgi:hypothetical protein
MSGNEDVTTEAAVRTDWTRLTGERAARELLKSGKKRGV